MAIVTGSVRDNTLVANVQAYMAANAVANSLGGLAQDVAGLMDQLSGNKPLDLNAWVNQVSQHLEVFKAYGAKFLVQAEAIFAHLSLSNDSTPLFQHLQEQFTQVAENVGQGLKNYLVAAINPGAWPDNILNFYSNPVANLGNYMKSFNFSTDQLWANLTGIINSANWKFDFSQNANGLMQGLSGQIQGAMTWVGDRWADVQKGMDIMAGGPERWVAELENVDWKSVSNACERFIPPQYRAANSALREIVFDHDYAAAIESLSKYLNKQDQTYVHTAVGVYKIYDAYSKSQKSGDFNYASAARALRTRSRIVSTSGSSTRITWQRSPAGRQRSNMRGAGKPPKTLISGTPHAAATCWPAES